MKANSVELSVLILARNEEHNIGACIDSVDFATEIIVIDDNSTDRTVEIAVSKGAKVINRALNGDWGGQQTFAIEQANKKWIFFIDCDERVPQDLAIEIQQKIQADDLIAYSIKRINHFKDKKIERGTLRPDYVCRLMPRENSKVEGYVHPAIIHPYKEEKLKNPMIHYTYASWDSYYAKFIPYTKLSAEKFYQNNKKVSFMGSVVFRPIWAFIKMYIVHGGFLDGKIGFVLAANHYSYTLMKYTRYYYMKNDV